MKTAVQFRSAFAAIALAISTTTMLAGPAAAVGLDSGRESAQVVTAPDMTKPAINVRWESKQSNGSTTTYHYSVKNIGLRDASGIGTSGMCWYKAAGGGTVGYNPHTNSPSWIDAGLDAGDTVQFTFSCPNSHNGNTLDHSTGSATAHFYPTNDQAADSGDSA